MYTQLSLLCSSYPLLVSNHKRGKVFFAYTFQTRQLLCLYSIHSLFYTDREQPKRKTITNEIFHYIDHIAICHWIMGDGAKKNKGIILCTDSFSFKEVVILMNVLVVKYNINSAIYLEKGKPRIYINLKELKKLLPYIKDHFVEDMLYKIIR